MAENAVEQMHRNEKRKFPLVGLISVIIGIFVLIGSHGVLAVAVYFQARYPNILEEDSLLDTTLAIIFFSTLAISMAGLLFGIIGLCQKNRTKLLSIVGVVFNLIPGLLTAAALLASIYDIE